MTFDLELGKGQQIRQCNSVYRLAKPRFAGLCCLVAVASTLVLYSYGSVGLGLPARVSGNSMVPTLMGDHLQATCDQCKFSFASGRPKSEAIACPNCFATQATLVGRKTADRVLIDKWKLRWKKPDRGDLVALADPDDESRLAVKRVMGLPGEHIEIRNGQLFCDGRAVESEIRFHVNDDRHRAREVSRWRNVIDSAWRQIEAGFTIDTDGDGERTHWLTYRHVNSVAGTDNTVIYDDIPFNRRVKRALNRCRNVSAEGRVLIRGSGRFLLKYAIRDRSWILEYLRDDEMVRVIHNQECQAIREFSGDQFDFRIEHFYNEISFSLAGQVVARSRMDEENLPPPAGTFFIGAGGVNVTVKDLLVQRAGYITIDSPVPVKSNSWQLENNEYFLLGDNSPVSRDSRHWRAITASDILGFVGPPEETMGNGH